MRLTSPVVAASSLVSLASARIIGVGVPDVIHATEGFSIRIYSENYIQSVADVAIAVGGAPVNFPPGSLGTLYDSFYLGPQQSNQGNTYFTKWIQPPNAASIPQGPVSVQASLFSLYGAAAAPTLTEYNVTTSLGSFTSSNYITSF